jgi:hypothetical protein
MSETMIFRINRALLIFGISGLVSGFGGVTSAIISFTVLRNDVQALSKKVDRLDTDRDTIVRHTEQIQNLTSEIRRFIK